MLPDTWDFAFDLSHLKIDFLEEEVKHVVWELGLDKALGPNGFPLIFFCIFWEIIKEDVLFMFSEMTRDVARLDMINFS